MAKQEIVHSLQESYYLSVMRGTAVRQGGGPGDPCAHVLLVCARPSWHGFFWHAGMSAYSMQKFAMTLQPSSSAFAGVPLTILTRGPQRLPARNNRGISRLATGRCRICALTPVDAVQNYLRPQ